jgi:thiol-disulfide isomerase/thioredoxin
LFALFLAVIGYLGSYITRHHYTYQGASQADAVRSYFPIDKKLPRIGAGTLASETSLSELAVGHPGGLIINFWATWCPPCVEELPSLELLDRQLRGRAAPTLPAIITISVDQSPKDVFDFYRTLDFKPALPVLFDKDGELARSVGTVQFPETYWIAPNGAVLYKWVGPENWVSTEVIERIARTDPTHH